MSAQATSWVLKNSRSKATTRCVMIAIANSVGPDGEGWCYVDQICSDANCHEDTYQEAVKWLIGCGELERDVREGGPKRMSGRYRPNLFRFPGMRTEIEVSDREGGESPPGQPPPSVRGESPPTEGGQSPPTLHPLGKVLDPKPPRSGCAERPKKRAADELWDTMLAACGLTGVSPTPSARGAWNKALKGLRTAGATPDEIRHRARAYRLRWPNVALTPTALERHWNEVVADLDPLTHDDPPELTLEDRAAAAVAYCSADARAEFGAELLFEGAMHCLEQNPHVHVSDLSIAAELYADRRAETVS